LPFLVSELLDGEPLRAALDHGAERCRSVRRSTTECRLRTGWRRRTRRESFTAT
jgi:hypothetical protein